MAKVTFKMVIVFIQLEKVCVKFEQSVYENLILVTDVPIIASPRPRLLPRSAISVWCVSLALPLKMEDCGLITPLLDFLSFLIKMLKWCICFCCNHHRKAK